LATSSKNIDSKKMDELVNKLFSDLTVSCVPIFMIGALT
jgi:hypothetical protein